MEIYDYGIISIGLKTKYNITIFERFSKDRNYHFWDTFQTHFSGKKPVKRNTTATNPITKD